MEPAADSLLLTGPQAVATPLGRANRRIVVPPRGLVVIKIGWLLRWSPELSRHVARSSSSTGSSEGLFLRLEEIQAGRQAGTVGERRALSKLRFQTGLVAMMVPHFKQSVQLS